MKRDKLLLVMHAGSGNHGCEAIVNSFCRMLRTPVLTVTNSVEEDEAYSLAGLCSLAGEKRIADNVIIHTAYYLWRKLAGDPESFLRYRFAPIVGKNARPLAVCVGGDNYCYESMVDDLMLANSMLNRQGTRTVLLGCSIEPELLERPEVAEDMKRYRLITARESITWQALRDAGVGGDRLRLYPDPAFTLEKKELPLPEGFIPGGTVGINLSPMAQEKESHPGMAMENYRRLIRYILDHTSHNVALIPHVVWRRNDDRKPLSELYEAFRNTGRVVLIGDHSCQELKGFISRCRFFVGARTHATIAAYSSLVPTLVAGYSVKARGIARDLFGTDEHYVLPVQGLEREDDLTEAFRWLVRNEEGIRRQLEERMPDYRREALRAGEDVESLWDELNSQPRT